MASSEQPPFRAWSFLTLSETASGVLVYPDEPESHYVYDTTVPNGRKVREGDLAVVRDGRQILGVGRIDRIKTEMRPKIRYRCPYCGSTNFKFRKTRVPSYYCSACGNAFEERVEEPLTVEVFTADYSRTFRKVEPPIPVSAIESLYLAQSKQNAIRELDVLKIRGVLERYIEVDILWNDEHSSAAFERGHAIPMPWAGFDPYQLEKLAKEKCGLELDPDIYRALVAAIKSRKHVVLTGPPGTAKTTLAEVTCMLANAARLSKGYAITTATSDWRTVDTVGGLRPDRDGDGLEFFPGTVVESFKDDKWIVIDELNRSHFDRAFGQLFTVLSGQSVLLPYEDSESGLRIQLCPDEVGRNDPAGGEGYKRIYIPENWRMIGTMNVFDKSLLYEMSFALMRRFAFIEVPCPADDVFEKLWSSELKDLPIEQTDMVKRVLKGLLKLRHVKEIGPAVFMDMARFSREYLAAGDDVSPGTLAFQLFYSYLLPQYEGADAGQGRELYKLVLRVVGESYEERLKSVLVDVLGIPLDEASSYED